MRFIIDNRVGAAGTFASDIVTTMDETSMPWANTETPVKAAQRGVVTRGLADSDPPRGTMVLKAVSVLMLAALLSLCSYVVPGAATASDSNDRKSAPRLERQGGTYPNRPVRFIVPFAPGGSDTVARMVGQKLSEKLGQQFVVDNRPGAASTLGTAIAAKAPADGYTILFTTATFAISAASYRNLPYDPIRDFVPVAPISSSPMLLVTPLSLPAKTVKEFIALAKAKPNQLNYASGGEGGINHLVTEKFMSMAGIRMTHVPYKGSGPALIGLLGDQVQFMIDVFGSTVLPLVQAGKLRALAVTSVQRYTLMPDLPTVAESGVPGYEAATWYGVLAPQGTLQSIVSLLNEQIVTTVKGADMREQLAKLGFEPVVSTPKQFADFLQSDLAKWARTVKEAGISLN